jgi:hypothetical protein
VTKERKEKKRNINNILIIIIPEREREIIRDNIKILNRIMLFLLFIYLCFLFW